MVSWKKQPKRNMFTLLIVLLLCMYGFTGCEEPDPVNADGTTGGDRSPSENQPPETYLHLDLYPDQMPDTTTSSKMLYWWGEDPDGRVIAYRYRWGKLITVEPDTGDNLDDTPIPPDTSWIGDGWTETRDENGYFVLPIRTASETFTFQVRALDNDSLIDPTPATLSFPVVNSKPSIQFRLGSNPFRTAETFHTFTTRTFVWDASDPDGNETISGYKYALDPTEGDTSWIDLEAPASAVTLRDLPEGSHAFYLKCVDVAGFESNTIHFPDSTSDTDPQEWVVKLPAPGGYLLVDDVEFDYPGDNNQTRFYTGVFEELYGEENVNFSTWKVDLELPFAVEDITETLMMFDRVLWYSYLGGTSFNEALNAITTFINTPGNRFVFTGTFDGTEPDTAAFMDLAADWSLSTQRLTNTPGVDTIRVQPVDYPALPMLQLGSSAISRPIWSFIPAEDAVVLYQLDENLAPPSTIGWYEGTPIIGLGRQDKSYSVFSVPLQPFNESGNVTEAIRVLLDE